MVSKRSAACPRRRGCRRRLAAMADARPAKHQKLEQADPVQGNVIIQFQSPEGESTGAQGDRRRGVHAPVSFLIWWDAAVRWVNMPVARSTQLDFGVHKFVPWLCNT